MARRQSTRVRLLGSTGSIDVADLAGPPRRVRRPKLATIDPEQATRVLGLDLAIGTTGWAFLLAGRPVAHGSFALPDRGRNETLAHWLGRRAVELARQVALLVSCHAPEVVGYEFPDSPRPVWSGGTKGREFHATQGLARAEGMLVAAWPSIGGAARLVAVPSSHVRRVSAGRANATKDQVSYGLRVYRGWDLTGWTEDAVDAAAVALAAREGRIE